MLESPKSLRIHCPAKINLHLEIVGRRDDGYHELKLLNTAITLADEIELTRAGKGVAIECDNPEVPTGPENLCHRAARAWFSAYPQTRTGIKIKIMKRIPVAGGLGGGSSDAAGVLIGLSRLTGFRPSPREMIRLGSELGADVPFFLYQSPAWALGKGEILKKAPLLPPWTFVLIRFDFGVSTAWAFKTWDLTNRAKRASLKSLKRGKLPRLGDFRNDLEPAVVVQHPAVKAAKSALLETGCMGAMMSGSGPTVFGVFAEEKKARRAALRLRKTLAQEVIIAGAISGLIITVGIEGNEARSGRNGNYRG